MKWVYITGSLAPFNYFWWVFFQNILLWLLSWTTWTRTTYQTMIFFSWNYSYHNISCFIIIVSALLAKRPLVPWKALYKSKLLLLLLIIDFFKSNYSIYHTMPFFMTSDNLFRHTILWLFFKTFFNILYYVFFM